MPRSLRMGKHGCSLLFKPVSRVSTSFYLVLQSSCCQRDGLLLLVFTFELGGTLCLEPRLEKIQHAGVFLDACCSACHPSVRRMDMWGFLQHDAGRFQWCMATLDSEFQTCIIALAGPSWESSMDDIRKRSVLAVHGPPKETRKASSKDVDKWMQPSRHKS
jgi:hypothetical protein